MKRLIPLLLLTSCTLHQGDRVQELFAAPRQSAALRNEHMVRDALSYRPSPAEMDLEALDPLSLPLAAHIYALQGHFLPKEERFLLASRDPLRDTIAVHLEFQILADNTLEVFTKEGSEIVPEAPIVLKEILQGQEIELLLVSKEKRTCSKMRFTPHPISLEADGARYTLHTTHRKGTHFLLHGAGLAPNETVTIREQSENELREHLIEADANGRFTQHIEPIVLGRLGGNAHITIERADLPPAKLDYTWGGKLEISSHKDTPFCPLVFAVEREAHEIDAIALFPKLQKKLTLL